MFIIKKVLIILKLIDNKLVRFLKILREQGANGLMTLGKESNSKTFKVQPNKLQVSERSFSQNLAKSKS